MGKARKPWTIRLDDGESSSLNESIKKAEDTEGFTGGTARRKGLLFLANHYLHGPPEKEILGSILDLERRINCDYLRRDHVLNEWVCDETVAKSVKRASAVLGNDPEVVLAKCEGHKLKVQELANQKIRDILTKQSVAKIIKFYKQFLKVSRVGFDVNCFICRADLPNGNMVISLDGVRLKCKNLDMDLVNIEKVCRQAVDLSKGVTQCGYFLDVVHAVHLDDIEALKKEINVEVRALPCDTYDTSECLGLPMCSVNMESLARNGRYCPMSHSPKMVVPLLEELEKPPK